MDDPTKGVAKLLKDKFSRRDGKTVNPKIQRTYRECNDTNFKKYYGELRGWHVVVGQLTDEEEKEHRPITLVLTPWCVSPRTIYNPDVFTYYSKEKPHRLMWIFTGAGTL